MYSLRKVSYFFFFLQELVIFGWVNLDSKPYVDNGLYLPLLHEILKAISRNLSILIKMNYFQCIKNIFQENVSLVYIFLFQLKSLQLVSFMKQQRKAHEMLQFRNAGSWNVFKIKFNGEMGVNSSLKWPKPPIKSQLPISVHPHRQVYIPSS